MKTTKTKTTTKTTKTTKNNKNKNKNNNNNTNKNNSNKSWTRVGTFAWCPTRGCQVLTFEPSRSSKLLCGRRKLPTLSISITPFSLVEDAHLALHLRFFLFRASNIEINSGPVCRECIRTISFDIALPPVLVAARHTTKLDRV